MLDSQEQSLIKGVPWPSYKPKASNQPLSLSHLQSEGYTHQKALFLAEASKLSYSTKSLVEETATKEWGFETCSFFQRENCEGFFATTPDLILITFRGTNLSLFDWMNNIDIRTVTMPYGVVHKGFWKHYKRAKKEFLPQLEAAGATGKKLYLTGHSLGGAVATLAAAELVGTAAVEGVYTFGQPRVGFEELKNFIETHYASTFHRFVNQDDPITRLPYKVVRDWQEVGTLIQLGGQTSLNQSDVIKSKTARPSLTKAEFERLKQALQKLKQMKKARRPLIQHKKLRDKPVDQLWPMDKSKDGKKLTTGPQLQPQRGGEKFLGEALNIDDHSIDQYITALKSLTQSRVS